MSKVMHKSYLQEGRYLFAGGGTGGHLFPAIAVADKIMELKPGSKILFVGTKNKIEARVVPQRGYDFKSIWISGFSRKVTLRNLLFPVKVIISMIQSLLINMKFKPTVAIGTGAYVSGPAIWGASVLGAKVILLEQNSYPGVTNRLLEKSADEIHVNFDESKKYFKNSGKIFVTGNPVRVNDELVEKSTALRKFGLSENKKVLLVLGGSLGAASINKAVMQLVNENKFENIQVLWQCGERYYDQYKAFESDNVKVRAFIDDMKAAYSCADLVIARAGATTIAEIAAIGLPTVFVPSSNVSADHQYKNAIELEKGNAAIVIRDSEVNEKLGSEIISLMNDEKRMNEMKSNIKKFATPNAAEIIAKRAISYVEGYKN